MGPGRDARLGLLPPLRGPLREARGLRGPHGGRTAPPVEGATTFPGFRTATAIPPRELTLLGRHRFSSYTLTFRLDEAEPGGVRLRAETRATFPGPAGGLYRLLVLGTGTHARLTRRLLTTVRLRAERPWRPSPA